MTEQDDNPYKYFDALTELVRTVAGEDADIEFWSGDASDSWEEFTLRVYNIAEDTNEAWFALDGHRVDNREVGIQIGYGTELEREHTAFITLFSEENSRDEEEATESYTFVPLNYLRTLLAPKEERDIFPHLIEAAHLIHTIDESLDIRFMLPDNNVDRSLVIPTILGMGIREDNREQWQQLDGKQVGPWTTDISLGSFDGDNWNIWIFLREAK